MYTYKDSSCLSFTFGYNWESVDIQNSQLSTIYVAYQKVYLVVHEFNLNKDIYVDMDAYRGEFTSSAMTVNEWLDFMNGKPLVTVDKLPDADLKTARYENAILQGFKIEPAKMGFNYPPEMPSDSLDDLAITRPDVVTDITLLHTHALISVNGYYHRTDTDGISAFVIDGGVTAHKKRCSHTGILSFVDIGAITEYQLKDEDILPFNEDGALKDGLIINVPEQFDGKSMIIILGGYIIRPDKEAFVRINERAWLLRVKALPYVERYFESYREIDMSSIKVQTPLENKDNSALVADLYSDDNIRAWLKLSQSFIAFVDTPVLYYNQINVRVSTLPGFITSYQEPKATLIMGHGKCVEYSKVRESQFWALRVQDPYYKQYAFSNAPARIQPVMTNYLLPWKQYQRTQGYLLTISGEKVKP